MFMSLLKVATRSLPDQLHDANVRRLALNSSQMAVRSSTWVAAKRF